MLLLNRRTVTARSLADRFQVTLRTIYRDIETLKQAGIPIASSQGVGGGYGIHPSFRIDRQMLSVDDLLSILTSLKGLEGIRAAASSEVFEKISALIPQTERQRIENVVNRTRIDMHPWGTSTQVRLHLTLLQEALSHNKLVSFDYRSINGQSARRMIEPVQLIFKASTWYIYGYCHIRSDFRLFRLSRMNNCSIEPKEFIPRIAPSIPDDLYELDSRPRTRIVLRFAPEKRSHLEDYFPDIPLNLQSDGSIIAELDMPEDEWVYGMILSHGDKVEVIAPQHLRKVIGDRAEQITRLYQCEPAPTSRPALPTNPPVE